MGMNVVLFFSLEFFSFTFYIFNACQEEWPNIQPELCQILFKTLKPNFLFLKPLNMYTIQSFHHGKKTVSKNSLEAQNDHDICDEWI